MEIGDYLSIGDKGGRLIIFEKCECGKSSKHPIEYQYLTELQSHLREFDYLKSTDIEERINNIEWLRTQGKNMYTLTTNDKIVKLWKISERTVKKSDTSNINLASQNNGQQNEKELPANLKLPKLKIVDSGLYPT